MITDEIINERLGDITNILSSHIVNRMQEPPLAIYLVGGYGRGEGAWYEDDKGLHPYNDFDIAVITDKPLSHDSNELLRKELANEVGIKWVDIDYYSLKALESLLPTIHNVDLLKGSSLIYGEDVFKQKQLYLNEQTIGNEDIILLYRTRIWTFLGSWVGPFHDLNVDESRFFKNQMAKAVLASCDMRLIKLNKYTSSYCERVKRIMEEYSTNEDLCELVSWALNEKMRPSDNLLGKQEMEKMYFRIKEEFINAFRFSLDNLSLYFLNPETTYKYYLWHTKKYVHHILSILFLHKSSIINRLNVFYAMNYVFHANEHGLLNTSMVNKASDLMVKYGYINQPIHSWDELRFITANARNNV